MSSVSSLMRKHAAAQFPILHGKQDLGSDRTSSNRPLRTSYFTRQIDLLLNTFEASTFDATLCYIALKQSYIQTL